MNRKTKPYRDIRMVRLANPSVAAAYLNATMRHSPENFLAALKNVAQARKMATVAKDAGVQRETLYRSLSEQGNPTYDTFLAILGAVGIKVNFEPSKTTEASGVSGADSGKLSALESSNKNAQSNALHGRDINHAAAFSGPSPLMNFASSGGATWIRQ